MANHHIDRQYITTALAHRHAAASADTQDALAQLATPASCGSFTPGRTIRSSLR